MRRAFIIILIILLIISLVLTGAWLMSRKKAVQSGREAPSFRVFLGLGDSKRPATDNTGGSLTPDQPSTPGGGVTVPQVPSSDTPPVIVSQFTSGPLTPTQVPTGPQVPGSQSTPGSSSGGATGPSSVPTGPGTAVIPNTPITPSTPINQGPSCNDTDLNIAFTQEEIDRLTALQNRFYAIAGTLSTDRDVQRELANYVSFRTKADQIAELYNYCVSRSPLITEQSFTTRTNTPFWRNAAIDKNGYLPASAPSIGLSSFFNSGAIDPRNVTLTQGVIQKIFKVNLW